MENKQTEPDAAQQATVNNSGTPNNSVLAQQKDLSTQQTTAQTQPRFNTSSIYPNPTNTGDAIDSSRLPQAEGQVNEGRDKQSSKVIVAFVIIFGAFIAAVSSMALLYSVRFIRIGGTAVVLSLITSGLGIILGLGIVARRELARAIFVVLSVITLIVALYYTYDYFKIARKLNSYSQSQKEQIHETIVRYQNNNSLPQATKEKLINNLKRQESLNNNGFSRTITIRLIGNYTMSILAIVFFTRSRVKEVFQ